MFLLLLGSGSMLDLVQVLFCLALYVHICFQTPSCAVLFPLSCHLTKDLRWLQACPLLTRDWLYCPSYLLASYSLPCLISLVSLPLSIASLLVCIFCTLLGSYGFISCASLPHLGCALWSLLLNSPLDCLLLSHSWGASLFILFLLPMWISLRPVFSP